MPVRHGAARAITGSAVARRVAVVLAIAILALLASPPGAGAAAAWQRPVPGEVVRAFDFARGRPFAAGSHRGADLAAPPGTRVRAACAGHVSHAGAVAGQGGVVTVVCGAFKATYLPLRGIAVRAAGARVARGSLLGTVAEGHGGLHVGVRRAGDPFAYEDPMAHIADPALPVPGVFPRGRPRAQGRPRAPSPRAPAPRLRTPAPGLRAPSPRLLPHNPGETAPRLSVPGIGEPSLRTSPHNPSEPAPWPVWAGAALVLAGCAGSGAAVARRRRAARLGRVLVPRSAG